jgi:phospholipid/cholesterol/gamma-HCH transport system substrate-binding protein
MKRPKFLTWEDLRVGVMIVVALAIVGVAMFALGRSANLFSKRFELVAFVADASGLRVGGPVTVAGTLAGTIKEIEFLPVDADTTRNLRILISVDAKMQDQVRGDSRASVRTMGLLGDKVINILPGTPTAPMLAAGDTLIVLPGVDFDAMLTKAAGAMDDVVALATDLRRITDGLVKGKGTIGQLLTDATLYNQLNGTLVRTNAMLARVQNSEGTFAKLLEDPALYNKMVASVTSLDSLVIAFRNPNGTLGKMVNDTVLYTTFVTTTKHFESIAVSADSLMKKLAAGGGTAGKMLNDDQLYDSLHKLVTDLSAMLADMRRDPKRYLQGVITIKPK